MEIIKIIGVFILLCCGYASIDLGVKIAVDVKEYRIQAIFVALLGIITVVTATKIYLG